MFLQPASLSLLLQRSTLIRIVAKSRAFVCVSLCLGAQLNKSVRPGDDGEIRGLDCVERPGCIKSVAVAFRSLPISCEIRASSKLQFQRGMTFALR